MLLLYLKKISEILLPRRCILCRDFTLSTKNLCENCLLDLPHLSYACQQCALPLYNENLLCGTCLKKPPPYALTFTLFFYESPIRELILALKFQDKLIYADLFGQLLIKAMQKWYKNLALPDIILPVPLHHSRLRERGFNQALEIARPISKALNIPIDISGIVRNKMTLPQANLSARDRMINMQQAFSTKHSYQNLTVAILDDVITTKATVTSLANLLLIKGAKMIHIWSCARAILNKKM